MRILVTGAAGFVGRALVRELAAGGHQVRAAVREIAGSGGGASLPGGIETVVSGSVGPDTDWTPALDGVGAVVHLAARVHVPPGTRQSGTNPYDEVNRAGTEQLARCASAAGVRRFVFLSTVKVHGEDSGTGTFRESDAPRPEGPYAVSKWRAEQTLNAMASAGSLDPVILRPPLVYGPGVKANFLSLLRAVDRGWPLPLGSVENRRSLIYVENLVSAIVRGLEAPAAAGRTYLLADGPPVSTPELIRRIARALDRHARLLTVPAGLLRLGGSIVGRRDAIERLLGSLAVDDGRIRRELGWTPPFSPDEGLQATAAWFHALRPR
jgi:nucleoside-diphosphate-sugar epimerase